MNKQFVKYVGPAILYLIVIFVVSSIPNLKKPDLGVSWEDKIYHAIEYFGLGILLFRAFLYWKPTRSLPVRFLLTFLLGSFIGAADEIYQSTVPNRVSAVDDWLIDTAASLAAAVVAVVYVRIRQLGQ